MQTQTACKQQCKQLATPAQEARNTNAESMQRKLEKPGTQRAHPRRRPPTTGKGKESRPGAHSPQPPSSTTLNPRP
eukprot:364811-Chlamydomonas_euryale.AAC.4